MKGRWRGESGARSEGVAKVRCGAKAKAKTERDRSVTKMKGRWRGESGARGEGVAKVGRRWGAG